MRSHETVAQHQLARSICEEAWPELYPDLPNLTTTEAAAILNVTRHVLEQRRRRGAWPLWARINGKIRYRREDLEWTCRPTKAASKRSYTQGA